MEPSPENPDPRAPRAGETPLHTAARLGDAAAIRRLIGEAAEVNLAADLGTPGHPWLVTPLMLAAGSADGATAETVRLLLELGADPAVVTNAGSAAAFACEVHAGGDAERLRLLLQAGSPLPRSPKRLNRLVCDVAATGDAERLAILLDRGGNPNGHFEPAEARREHLEMRQELEKYRSAQPDFFEGMPKEFIEASEARMKQYDDERLERNSNAPSPFEVPLHRAAAAPTAACVKLLLERGADPLRRDSSDRTAMYTAATHEAVQLLQQAGVPIEDADEYGWSPLDDAVGDGVEAFPRVKALIAAGANVNATHDNGYTVFMSAVGSGRSMETLRALIAAGADPKAVSGYGYNAFHAAIDVNGAEANTEQSIRETFTYLKQLGVDIEHRTTAGQTPLAHAISRGSSTEVRVLCELGANPSAVGPMHRCDDDGCSVQERPLLFEAAVGMTNNSGEKVESLLKAGADPLAKDPDGYTVVQLLVSRICAAAPDWEQHYDRFFTGLQGLRLEGHTLPTSRDEFVKTAAPFVSRYVNSWGRGLPLGSDLPFATEIRRDDLDALISLICHEGWARHEHLRTQAAASGPPPNKNTPR